MPVSDRRSGALRETWRASSIPSCDAGELFRSCDELWCDAHGRSRLCPAWHGPITRFGRDEPLWNGASRSLLTGAEKAIPGSTALGRSQAR